MSNQMEDLRRMRLFALDKQTQSVQKCNSLIQNRTSATAIRDRLSALPGTQLFNVRPLKKTIKLDRLPTVPEGGLLFLLQDNITEKGNRNLSENTLPNTW